jgi:hypothetical protein
MPWVGPSTRENSHFSHFGFLYAADRSGYVAILNITAGTMGSSIRTSPRTLPTTASLAAPLWLSCRETY